MSTHTSRQRVSCMGPLKTSENWSLGPEKYGLEKEIEVILLLKILIVFFKCNISSMCFDGRRSQWFCSCFIYSLPPPLARNRTSET